MWSRSVGARSQGGGGRWAAVAAFVLSAGVAAGVAAAWVPFRAGNSNVDVALMLVVVMTAAGASRRRAAIGGATIAAGAAFTFFDTRPYERFVIARQPDLATAVSLVVVGLLTGELALRVAKSRRQEASAAADLSRVRQAAALLADGEELVVMVGAVARELVEVAHLDDCWFSTEELAPGIPLVARDGVIESPSGPPVAEIAVPVWALGQVAGHFVMRPRDVRALRTDQLKTAMTLADQVGAALAAQTPLPPLPPVRSTLSGAESCPVPRLRVVKAGPSSRSLPGGSDLPARGTAIAG